MTIQEIADRLVSLNRTGDYMTAYEELFSSDVVSVENWGGEKTEFHGLEAIKQKIANFEAGVVETHEVRVSEPIVADSSFAVTFFMDTTYGEGGMMPAGRSQMTELAVYTVKDGKIIREEFQA